jgi:hypothetical protein
MEWFGADRQQLYGRILRLETELSIAAALAESSERVNVLCGQTHSTVAAEQIAKWRKLLSEKPATGNEEIAHENRTLDH